jgi:serine/threonine protein kinase
MHDRGFIHGDVKPRNIVRWLRSLKLIDLDASAQIGKDFAWSKYSSAYIPPEAVRLCFSLRSEQLMIVDASDSAEVTVSFTFLFPFDIPSGSSFTITIAPISVAAVREFTLDAVDSSSCISVKDCAVIFTSKFALVAGSHNFVIVGAFMGNLPAAESMHAELQHELNTLDSVEGLSKDCLTKCFVTIRNTKTDTKLAAVDCRCSCSRFPRASTRAQNSCTGVCGVAHPSHDMWALGVILYRLCARESLWSEDDEDNIKDDSGHLLELALWTDAFKEERLQKIEDTATRTLVSKLLEKDPWKRPRSIDDVLAIPFNEMDVIKLHLQQMVPSDASQSSNLVGSVKDLRTGKFSDAAYGLRPYLKVAGDWNEEAACTLQGMQDEVDVLKDCPDCAQVQADVLQQLKCGEAAPL